jgi:hypothetical protein
MIKMGFLEKFVLAFMCFSVFMVGGVMIFGHTIDNYDVNTTRDEVFDEVYNKINDTYDIGKDLNEDVFDADVEGGDESWSSMIRGGYNAIKSTILDAIPMMRTILEAVSIKLGLGTEGRWLVDFAITAVVVSLIFAAIYMFFRFKS